MYIGGQPYIVPALGHSSYKLTPFLVDRTNGQGQSQGQGTNGRAYGTMCRPSVCRLSVCNVCTVTKRYVLVARRW